MTTLQQKRTEKVIFTAFQELLDQKPFSKITVNDITTQALMHRSTFYTHFTDKFDLLDRFLRNLFPDSTINAQAIYDHPFTAFSLKNDQVLVVLQHQSRDDTFRNGLFQFMMHMILQLPSDKTELEKFFIIGRVKAITMWISETHQPYDILTDYAYLDDIFQTGQLPDAKHD